MKHQTYIKRIKVLLSGRSRKFFTFSEKKKEDEEERCEWHKQ